MYQYTGRSLSPLAKCKDGYDAGNVEKGVQNMLRSKIGQGELTGEDIFARTLLICTRLTIKEPLAPPTVRKEKTKDFKKNKRQTNK